MSLTRSGRRWVWWRVSVWGALERAREGPAPVVFLNGLLLRGASEGERRRYVSLCVCPFPKLFVLVPLAIMGHKSASCRLPLAVWAAEAGAGAK